LATVTGLGEARERRETVDRAAEFRRAQSHSRRVRTLRIALPVAAVVLLATFGLAFRLSIGDGRGGTISGRMGLPVGDKLTMQDPEYEGFNKDGSRFRVTAKSAAQDPRQNGPILLETIDARLLEPSNAMTRLVGTRGTWDTKSSVLELKDGIRVLSDTGLKATLNRATVYPKEGKVVSSEPVLVEMTAGQVHGNSMTLHQKTRAVSFGGGVAAKLVPAERERTATAERPAGTAAKAGEPVSRLLGATSGGPIDVHSERLDIDDVAHTARFHGGVTAVQGDAKLEAPELVIAYEAAQPPGEAKPSPASAADLSAAQGKVKEIVARPAVVLTRGSDVVRSPEARFDALKETVALTGGVLIVSAGERQVTGDRADLDLKTDRARLTGTVVVAAGADRTARADVAEIDQKADTALLTGQVVVNQGLNVLRGGRLALDRKAGTSELTRPGGRIAARFVRTADSAASQPKSPDAAGAASPAGLVFRTDPNSPIDVEADVLTSSDAQKQARFRGSVRVTQGEFKLETQELIASYTGDAGIAQAAAGAQPKERSEKKAKPAEPAQIKTVKAPGKVVVTSAANQRVDGDWAELDMRTNLVTIGGDVVVREGRNVIKATRLIIDMTTGESRFERQAPGAGVIVAAPPPVGPSAPITKENAAPPAVAQGNCNGRPCAVFFPNDLKERQKQPITKRAGTPEPVAKPPANAASSWGNTSTTAD
jgi:lipopolysaccharide export system protein LptA